MLRLSGRATTGSGRKHMRRKNKRYFFGLEQNSDENRFGIDGCEDIKIQERPGQRSRRSSMSFNQSDGGSRREESGLGPILFAIFSNGTRVRPFLRHMKREVSQCTRGTDRAQQEDERKNQKRSDAHVLITLTDLVFAGAGIVGSIVTKFAGGVSSLQVRHEIRRASRAFSFSQQVIACVMGSS